MDSETVSRVERRRLADVLRDNGRLALKAFAVFATAVLITVAFSQLVDTEAVPADDGDDWRFEESTRRLTVAPGGSTAPQLVWSPAGALHVGWADVRDGSAGVYHKASRNGGWTFSGDRALADGFLSVGSPSLAVAPRDGLVGVAWEGRPNASSASQVYARASSDDGRAWGRAATVGAGRSPALAATASHLVLAYVHENASEDQVRLVALSVADGAIRGARALLGFNGSAMSLALVVTGGRAHLAWAQEVEGATVIAHVSVTLATGAASQVHVVAGFATSFGGLALTGRGDQLALAWSDDSLGSFDVHAAFSGTAGETWVVGPPIEVGPSGARTPAAAVGARGLVAIIWDDDRTGTPQAFGRIVTLSGTPLTRAVQVSDSPAGASQPAIAIGSGRDLVVAWSDARHGDAEVYADLDALLDRPRLPTIRTFAKRLAREDFAPPARASRAELMRLLQNADAIIARREESRAVAYLQERVMPRFDGASGGDPRDDLVINATAQLELTRLAQGLVDFLRDGSPPGTRVGNDDDDGEPDPPPPGDPGDPPPQPAPDPGDGAGDVATVSDVSISDITSTSGTVSWNVSAGIFPVQASWVDWGIASTGEHRTWDNTTPYQAPIGTLEANTTYKVRAGAQVQGTSYWSDTFSFYSGVAIHDIVVTNLSYDRATVEWTTNLPSTSVVLYGTNESNLVYQATGASGTSHQVNLTGLTSTKYYYRVRSVALADATLVGESGTMSFLAGLQLFKLARTASHVAGYYNVTFAWATNFQGTTEVRYGTDVHMSSKVTGANGTSHTAIIWGLASGTTYNWQVYSRLVGGDAYACISSVTSLLWDLQGNEAVCTPGEKTGVDTGPIQTPRITITNVTFDRGQTWIHAKWNTTYAGNASVTYRMYGGAKTTIDVSEATLVHGINVATPPLATGTTYILELKSTSASNGADTASSGERYVTTRDITLSNVVATPAIYSANLTWTTSGNATSIVWYGITSARWKATGADGTSHFVQLTSLLPETSYLYKVVSSSLSNLNDTVTQWGSVRTLVGPNDANSSTDAGNNFTYALFTEPGFWKGWTDPAWPYNDTVDFYQFRGFAGQELRVTLTPPLTHDYDLHIWTPAGGETCYPWWGGAGVPEGVLCPLNTDGLWRLEVRRMSGNGRGDYTLDFSLVGAGREQFVVDVGASGDTDGMARTPGVNVGETGWSASQVSPMPSTATEAYRTKPFPDYREVSANGTFYLNLYRATWERYNDYLFTIQYYGTQDTNVSVWNGQGWIAVSTVYGQANWRAASFLLEHTLFYDADPVRAGLNVKLRFEKAVQVDLIAAIPWKHTTYVGNGSDDDLDAYHVPGVMTAGGWVNDGFGYKNATAVGADVFVTPRDLGTGYAVSLRFDGNSSGITVQRFDGVQWLFAASVSNFTVGEAQFVTDPSWYAYDAFPSLPGTQLWLRLVPKDRLNETTMITLVPVHWETDAGVAGDNDTSLHVPGMSVYTNGEWGNPGTLEGRTVRIANPGTTPNLYLNLPWPHGAMIAYATYKVTGPTGGLVQVWDGTQWVGVGTVVADGQWHTAVLFVQGSCPVAAVCQDGGIGTGEGAGRVFHDEYGDAFVNALLQFTVPVALDYLWVDVDGDGDNLTNFGEPNAYAYYDGTTHPLNPGQSWPVDWYAAVEGRWQFDLRFQSYGTGGYGQPVRFSKASVTVDGVEIARMRSYVSGVKTASAPAMLCRGAHRLRIDSVGDVRVDVTEITFRKLPTNPDLADTDGDGLRDGQEACAKRTDPTVPDTDGDGLTDYEETYQFFYDNATVTPANVTVNVTVDAAGEYAWKIKTSATAQQQGVGSDAEAVVYLDGQLKWTKTSSTGWTDLITTFDANLPKGLHSLQVQKASGATLTLKLVNVTKPRFTNALFWDTDRDSLSDGDELLGQTGWMISPTKEDTDGDGALDGAEVRTMHTDPLLQDTDHDGFNDKVDVDPLHDLVVQLRIARFDVADGGCSRPPCSYWARPHVAGNWTNSSSVEDTDQDGFAFLEPNHLLSVNVPDTGQVTVKIQVFANDVAEPNLRELDVASGSATTYTTTVSLTDPDRYGGVTGGTGNYAIVLFDIRIFRVGKANTLLLTPNDWSTLSNGTVGGTPTGLHRYVGEQRFVFVLLNVTDGHGDLASYDFETKDWNGAYTDLSGSGLPAGHYGDVSTAGRFGQGAQLDGTSGSDITVADDPRLDDIAYDLTVSFWIRSDEDYVGGSGWRWSTGREGLWRVGYYNDPARDFHGLRFEVTDKATGLVRSAENSTSLYAGRWYHVSAVLDRKDNVGGYWWSEFRIYVNGEEVGFCSCAATEATDGSSSLRIGHDGASGGRFRGTVDEFRLDTVARNETSIRGLLWFLHGSNALVVPRGVFFDSELFGALNSTWDASSPLAGASINANDNNGSAHLNARVIQLVITKNATIWAASRILDLVVTNSTGATSVFLLLVASEFYTLGLVEEVDDLVPNAVVENSGNFSAPPPSPTLWELYWNTITGLADAFWDAVEAVGQFFLNVVKFLVNVLVGLVLGLVFHNWTYFQENVIEPLVEALEAIVDFFVALAKAAFDLILGPLVERIRLGLMSWGAAISLVLGAAMGEYSTSGAISDASVMAFGREMFLSPAAAVLAAVGIAVGVGIQIVTYLLLPFFYLLPLVPIFVMAAISLAMTGRLAAPSVPQISALDIHGATDTAKQLSSHEGGGASCEGTDLWLGLLSLLFAGLAVAQGFLTILLLVSEVVLPTASYWGWFLDFIAFALLAVATLGDAIGWDHGAIQAVALVALIVSIFGLILDIVGLPLALRTGLGAGVASASSILLSAVGIAISVAVLRSC